jgi:hypothetical protein
MKNKLFGVDIRKWKGDSTDVTFWRHDSTSASGGSCREIPIRTMSTYNRLWRLLPGNSYVTIHAKEYVLTISMLLEDK